MVTVSDNRSGDRRPVTWRAKVLLPKGQMVEVRVTDASSNGLGLVSPRPLPQEGLIQLAVQVPSRGSPGKSQVVTGNVRVAFQVLRGDGYQLGVEWVQLDAAMKDVITRAIER